MPPTPEKLDRDTIGSLIKLFHPNSIKENVRVFLTEDRQVYECETYDFKEDQAEDLVVLLYDTYPDSKFDMHLYKISQEDRVNIEHLIEKGYITKDNWCPIKTVPIEDRSFTSFFRIEAKFLPKPL
jgi:hypothetical protein